MATCLVAVVVAGSAGLRAATMTDGVVVQHSPMGGSSGTGALAMVVNDPDQGVSTLRVLDPGSDRPHDVVRRTGGVLTTVDWAVDASWMVVTETAPDHGGLVRVSRDGDEQVLLDGPLPVVDAVVAPDGHEVVAVRRTPAGDELVAVPATGGPARPVVVAGRVRVHPTWSCSPTDPTSLALVGWLADGRLLAEATTTCGEGRFTDVVAIARDGADLVRLAGGVDGATARVGPDGTVVTWTDATTSQVVRYAVADGSRDEVGVGRDAVASTADALAVVVSEAGPEGSVARLVVAPRDDTTAAEPVEGLAGVLAPRWSPDGAALTASVATPTGVEQWLLGRDGDARRRVDGGTGTSWVLDVAWAEGDR